MKKENYHNGTTIYSPSFTGDAGVHQRLIN